MAAECPYGFTGEYDPKSCTCRGCGERLQRRSYVWCKTIGEDGLLCATRYLAHHDWGSARREALKRSGGHCAHCGTWLDVPYHQDCGPECGMKRVARLNRRIRARPDFRAPFYARRLWLSARRLDTIMRGHGAEVNHIVPREGQGYGLGCWNHQENLEALCHECHVDVTRRQRRERAARARGGLQASFTET